jgi:hypothetical protein
MKSSSLATDFSIHMWNVSFFQMDDTKGGLSHSWIKKLPSESISWATLGDEFAMSCITNRLIHVII